MLLIIQKKVEGTYEPAVIENVKVTSDYSLDLTKYCQNNDQKPIIYESFAVINFHGNDNKGHFTATCKFNDSDWYNFDDALVKLIDNKSDCKWNNADNYMIFYEQRKDGTEDNKGLKEDITGKF